ncbi:MAG: hypothetical protein BGO78_12530 [Chloroflexi bacterium 44-23]|nr:MAG: hypothetical protein BGO78_12530 [Chloroflexi bacterium 44-23]
MKISPQRRKEREESQLLDEAVVGWASLFGHYLNMHGNCAADQHRKLNAQHACVHQERMRDDCKTCVS